MTCLGGVSSTSRLPGRAGTSGTQAYSNVLETRRDADGANSADVDVLQVHQSSGFLNRVRWFDSGRGHSARLFRSGFAGWSTPTTVRRHLENVYAKLGVHTRTAAVTRYFGLRGNREREVITSVLAGLFFLPAVA